MRIGLDYRTVGSSPHSGISRQVYAMEQALESLPGTQVTRFTVAPLDDPLRQRAVCPPWGCPRTAMHQPHQRLRFEAGFLPRALREQGIDLYISTFNMGLPLPPRPPGVRYALLIHDLFQITLKNYHANRLKALVYRVSDYLSIAYALRVADRVWTPSQYSADEAVRLFPGVAGKVRVLPNQVDGFADEPADLSARGLPPRYWLLVGTRELRKNVPWFVSAWARSARPGARRAAAGAGRQPRPPARGTTRLARPARARRARRRRTARAVPPGRAALATVLRGRLRPAGGRGAERRHAGGGGQRHLAGRSHPAVGAALRPATAPPWNA